jgi:electron transport complex protein RnfB
VRVALPIDVEALANAGSAIETARIEPGECIGCALCLRACPVDAIVGAATFLHAVVEDWCTGCRLCVPPCPVDCITVGPADRAGHWTLERAAEARRRESARQGRLRPAPVVADTHEVPVDARASVIEGAIARAKAKARGRQQPGDARSGLSESG